MGTISSVRRRGAAATREAILASARKAFARWGYDGAGVREIAAGAGVTAMLVNRYFGSKEGLFREVLDQTMTAGSRLAGEVMTGSDPARQLAEAVVALTRANVTPADGFLILLQSASSASAADIGRPEIERHHLKTIAAALKGDRTPERAALILSVIAGVQTMRQMMRLPVLAQADEGELIELLAGLFAELIERR